MEDEAAHESKDENKGKLCKVALKELGNLLYDLAGGSAADRNEDATNDCRKRFRDKELTRTDLRATVQLLKEQRNLCFK